MPELFALVDCNNFYASCERVFHPDLEDRPIVVLSNNDGCVIARSNESKALGIGMGVPLYQIRQLIDDNKIAVFSSNYTLYGDMSRRVMTLLSRFTPRLEVYSIDEAFMDLSGISEGESLRRYCEDIVKLVRKGTGIPVSIGIGPTRTLAKVASRFAKKYPAYHGVCMIDTDERRMKALRLLDVSDVWGIGRRMAARLGYLGIRTAWGFTEKPERWVKKEFSVMGVRTWKELHGVSCVEMNELPHRKSICTSRSFPEHGITDRNQLESAVSNFAAECARKLRTDGCCCSEVTVFAHTSRFRDDVPRDYIQQHVTLTVPTSDPSEIIKAALLGLRSQYHEGTYHYKKAGVIVWGIVSSDAIQTHLFDTVDRSRQSLLLKTIDEINQKNGHNTIRIAMQDRDYRKLLKHQYVSQHYTTDIRQIIELKVK